MANSLQQINIDKQWLEHGVRLVTLTTNIRINIFHDRIHEQTNNTAFEPKHVMRTHLSISLLKHNGVIDTGGETIMISKYSFIQNRPNALSSEIVHFSNSPNVTNASGAIHLSDSSSPDKYTVDINEIQHLDRRQIYILKYNNPGAAHISNCQIVDSNETQSSPLMQVVLRSIDMVSMKGNRMATLKESTFVGNIWIFKIRHFYFEAVTVRDKDKIALPFARCIYIAQNEYPEQIEQHKFYQTTALWCYPCTDVIFHPLASCKHCRNCIICYDLTELKEGFRCMVGLGVYMPTKSNLAVPESKLGAIFCIKDGLSSNYSNIEIAPKESSGDLCASVSQHSHNPHRLIIPTRGLYIFNKTKSLLGIYSNFCDDQYKIYWNVPYFNVDRFTGKHVIYWMDSHIKQFDTDEHLQKTPRKHKNIYSLNVYVNIWTWFAKNFRYDQVIQVLVDILEENKKVFDFAKDSHETIQIFLLYTLCLLATFDIEFIVASDGSAISKRWSQRFHFIVQMVMDLLKLASETGMK